MLETQNARAAYGALAERAAMPFDRNDPVIIFDPVGAAEALRECVWRSFRGDRFFVRPVLQPEHRVRADSVAAAVMTSFHSIDERRIATAQAFDGTLNANGRPLRDIPAYDAGSMRLMQAAARLADGIIVSSQAERRRIHDLLQTDADAMLWDLRDPSVPAPLPGDALGARDAIVIWAPELAGEAAMSFAVALADVHCPLLLVAATAPSNVSPAQWISPSKARDALIRAKTIVVTNSYGSETAASLSAWNAPLVVDADSGAQERLQYARAFDSRKMNSIFDAVVAALGAPPARDVCAALHPTPPDPLLTDGPLVSIIMPTFDRPALLRYALESCKRQTYRNVETIVAVGGGRRFGELAKEFPEVRFVHLEENVPAASMNAAFAAAAGEYIAILNDDDVFFPHHVASLVTALERSGAAVAHGDVVTAYLRGSDDEWSLYGFESNMSRSADTSSLLIANRIGATSAMIRRSCIPEQIYDMSIPYYRDYALWLSLSVSSDFVHVERITSCYTIRNHGAAQQSTSNQDRAVAAYQAIYARHDVTGRPLLEQQRAQMIESVRAGGTALISQPAMQVTPITWPPF